MMEEEQLPQEQINIFSFSLDETSKEHIRGIGMWAGINAVLAFIGLALDIFKFMKESNQVYRRTFDLYLGFRASDGSSLFLQVAVSVLLNVFLLMASIHLKKGLQLVDRESLSKGFNFLKIYYTIYSIVTIIVLAVVLFFFLKLMNQM